MSAAYSILATGNYTLKNVRLETGFITGEAGVTGTQTGLFCVEVEGGKINPAVDQGKYFVTLRILRILKIVT